MIITSEGQTSEGVMILPERLTYSFQVQAKGNLDLFTFETCHRVKTIERAWEGSSKRRGFFSRTNKREVIIPYIPNPGIESGYLACPVRLGGYEKIKGRHSWGFVDFKSKYLTLQMKMKCAGKNTFEEGVAVCQSKAGTLQEITFPGPVFTSSKARCPRLRSEDMTTFRFPIPVGECIYRFRGNNLEGKSLRLTTIGYQGILIREK